MAACVDADPAEIARDVFCLGPRGRSQTNVYLVRDESVWALVDAGWQQDGPSIDGAVHRLLGLDTRPAAILLTHVHPDHAGSARALSEAWGCPIFLHPAEMPIAAGDFATMERCAGPLDRWVILPAMRALGRRRREAVLARRRFAELATRLPADGTIPGLGGWEWVATPGHTPGHVSFVRRADRVVLTGDALVTLLVNSPAGVLVGRNGLSGPPWYTTWDRRAGAASIRDLAALEPTVVGGGHGRPLTGPGATEAVRRFAVRTASDPAA